MASTSDTLRALLAEPALLQAPGVYDGLGAHLVRRHGFRAAHVSGAGVAVAGFGLPDAGLTTATEMIERIGVVTGAVGLPVVADAETGHGGPVHVVRAVRAYERAGVAGMHLRDSGPVDVEAYRRSLAAALENRGTDLVVVARIDAGGPSGIDGAVRRAGLYAADGADAVLLDAPRSAEVIERVAAEVGRSHGVPLVVTVVPGGPGPRVDEAELERLGFAAALYPTAMLAPAAAAMSAGLADLLGREDCPVRDGPAALSELVGRTAWAELSRRYGPAHPGA